MPARSRQPSRGDPSPAIPSPLPFGAQFDSCFCHRVRDLSLELLVGHIFECRPHAVDDGEVCLAPSVIAALLIRVPGRYRQLYPDFCHSLFL